MTGPAKVLAVTSTLALAVATSGWLVAAALVSLLDEQVRRCRGCIR